MMHAVPTHRPPHVLVVEDEGRLRDLLVDVLPDMGFTATAVRSAEEARRVMEADPHEIVLLDLHLPLMSGMELFELIHQRWPSTQVVIQTGFGDLEAARQAIHLDVVDFLTKPCHLSDVEAALDRACRRLPGFDGANTATVPAASADSEEPPESPDHPATLAQTERKEILAALERHGGNRTAAAAELGISRRTMHYRLRAYREENGE